MAQSNKPTKRWHSKQFWLSITPLFVTLIALGFINIVGSKIEAPHSASVTNTAVPTQRATPLATLTRLPILQATILPDPTPSNTPRPGLNTAAIITLLGPPPMSNVLPNGRIAFYWHYSDPMIAGQQFVLTLWQNNAIVYEKPIDQPNLGDEFQLLLDLATLSISPETAVWRLHLEWADSHELLLTSEERTLIFLSE